MFPEELKYSQEHEWVRVEGSQATIGITSYAQQELGDIVFVELPEIGKELSGMAEFGVAESVKTVSNLYCPVAGKVVEINQDLTSQPQMVNQDPYGKGWLIKVEMSSPAEAEKLMSAEEYQKAIA